MKSITFALSLLFAFPISARNYTVTSPDGNVVADIDEHLDYSLSYASSPVLTGSMAINANTKTVGPRLSSPKRRSVNAIIPSPFYRNDSIIEKYSECTFNVGKDWKLQLRAYDEGFAYRWIYGGKKIVNVDDEAVTLDFAGAPRALVPFVRTDNIDNFESQFFNSFENIYTDAPLSELDSRRLAFLPLYVECAENIKILLTESNVQSYPGLYLNHSEGQTLKGVFAPKPKKLVQGGYLGIQKLIGEREDYIATLDGPRTLPWRVVMIAPDDASLAQNQLSYLLAEPSKISDTSWIRPGKVAWDWWNDWNLTGVDFPAGVNNETYKYYIDFASDNGIEYVIMDDGWSDKSAGDLFTVVPEINLQGLVNYAKDRNVGIILWAGYLPFDKDIEEVCRRYSEMGVKGFKVDFLDRNDQTMQEFEQKAAEMCAKYHLLLDLHGTHMPGSMNRTWPNVLNFEGVHGLEQMKWNPVTIDQMKYDVAVPYIRQASGPMDYTQGAMRNAAKSNYYPCNSEPMSQGTRCHQLALYMVFDAPLTMLCDSPSAYKREKECTDFITGIPTVWDETRVLDGRVGEYIITARRKGDTWYVGGITDWTPREFSLDLSFLPADGNFTAEWFVDGSNAHRAASDYKKVTEKVNVNSRKSIKLASGGGFAVKISK